MSASQPLRQWQASRLAGWEVARSCLWEEIRRVWGKRENGGAGQGYWQLRTSSSCGERISGSWGGSALVFCSVSSPPPWPSGMAVPVACLPAPSLHRTPTPCLPARAQAVPEGPRAGRSRSRPKSAGAAIAAAARGEKGGSPGCGKGTLESERKGNFIEEEVASVSPYMPSCEWLGRGYQLVWLPLRRPPQLLIPGGSGKANGDGFSKMLPDFPSSSTCPFLPPPERQTGVHKNPANTSLGVRSCLTLWERDRDTSRFHTQI